MNEREWEYEDEGVMLKKKASIILVYKNSVGAIRRIVKLKSWNKESQEPTVWPVLVLEELSPDSFGELTWRLIDRHSSPEVGQGTIAFDIISMIKGDKIEIIDKQSMITTIHDAEKYPDGGGVLYHRCSDGKCLIIKRSPGERIEVATSPAGTTSLQSAKDTADDLEKDG